MTVQIITGDCRRALATLPAGSVHCCVTSPPYWNLRDYGVDGQIGLEASVDEWVAELVAVFREVRRVLRDDGTVWLNLGDSYAGVRGAAWGPSASSSEQRSMTASRRRDNEPVPRNDVRVPGLKAKDLVGQPWRVAFALQADGWYLRQDIVWHKPNPMPESVRDRCTKAHEYVFLLSKSESYHYDFEAMQEPVSPNTHARLSQNVLAQRGSNRAHGGEARGGRPMKAMGRGFNNGVGFGHGFDPEFRGRKVAAHGSGTKNNSSMDEALATMPDTRNRRSVWTVPTEPFKEAHFATFPSALIEPCILAGCPEGGTVLDPFGGAGTTGLVADRLQRNAVLIELNPAYVAIARKRISGDAPLFAEVEAA